VETAWQQKIVQSKLGIIAFANGGQSTKTLLIYIEENHSIIKAEFAKKMRHRLANSFSDFASKFLISVVAKS
jgi:hypothetical protein